MLTKRSLIVFLVGVNLLLFMVLVVGITSPPAAYAQTRGPAGSFLTATAAVEGQEYDVLYILDLATRRLHAFAPTNVQSKKPDYRGYRDLEKDFRR